MTQVARPSTYPGAATPLLILGVAWGGGAVLGLVWVAGRCASVITGKGWDNGPGLGAEFLGAILRGRWEQAWPGVPAVLVLVLLLILVAIAAAPGVMAWRFVARRRRRTPDDPVPSMALPVDVHPLSANEVRARALRLRPSLKWMGAKAITVNDAGIFFGNQHRWGTPLAASFEDVILAVMAPRTGKTTAIAGPGVINAPGPVVATSNRADLWALTSRPRSQRGQVWVFDPQSIAHAPQNWHWNPLAGITTVEEAHRFALHFVQGVKTERTDFWSSAAHGLLTALFLAAAASGGTVRDVYRWLNDPANPRPKTLLEESGFHDLAAELAGRQSITHETRDGVYETARTAAQCLRDPAITAWVTPDNSRRGFDPAVFVESTDTLHLLSKDGAGAAAPLVAALTDRVIRAGVRLAEVRGGRLDPPLLLMLDEAANICRIADLPDLYSHLGSRGIIPVTILQSYQQGIRAWGEHGMGALWSAATIKLIGAGIDNAQLAEDLSRVVGEHDVTTVSYTRNTDGSVTESVSTRRQRILPPDAIRALPKGAALLLATGTKPALIDLLPWYERPEARELAEGNDVALRELTSRAARTSKGLL